MFHIYFANQFYFFLCDNRENLISRLLLDYNGCIRSEYSFIDMLPGDKVTFLTTEKLVKIHKSSVKYQQDIYTFIDYNRSPSGYIYSSNLRTEIKIGRLK